VSRERARPDLGIGTDWQAFQLEFTSENNFNIHTKQQSLYGQEKIDKAKEEVRKLLVVTWLRLLD
jgi:hypothetical protein